MAGYRLTIDQAMGLNGLFLGVAGALEQEAAVQRPTRRLFTGFSPEDAGPKFKQDWVYFSFLLDLGKEALCNRAGIGKNGNRNLRIPDDLLE